jgi:acyl-coenzyme A synthetase/AMP-(fatty) acid ligase
MIVNRIYEWARVQPNKTAIIWNGAPFSYESFARHIEATRKFLATRNLPPSKTAVVLIHNLANAWVAIMALRALGLRTVQGQSAKELAALKLKDVACVVTIANEKEALRRSMELLTALRLDELVILPEKLTPDPWAGGLPVPLENGPPFGDHILYTSGTTGDSKKIPIRGATDDAHITRLGKDMFIEKKSVLHGLSYGTWTAVGYRFPSATWQAGGTVVIDQSQNMIANFFKHGVTQSFLFPAILSDLLKRDAGTGPMADRPFIEVGGGFVPLDVAEGTVRRLTPKFSILYGATETPIIMRAPFVSKPDLYWLKPVDYRIVEIVDEAGNLRPDGQEGEFRVRLIETTDCFPYIDDPDASARIFRDGYFYPGDIAVRRADGRVRILGRTSDVLNFRGEKKAVGPLEERAQQILGADNVCLFSGLNAEGKEEVVVAIESERTPEQSRMDEVARDFAMFDKVRFEVMKSFPRTQTGTLKVQRVALRKLVFSEAEQIDPEV